MKINFREIELSDVDFVLEIENNKNIWKVSDTITEYDREEIISFITKIIIEGLDNQQKRWIITCNNEACGCIDLFDYDRHNSRAGIGIVIHESKQNKGIATKALKKFIIFCKKELKLNQLYCTVLPNNESSMKLFTKRGFIKTGLRKEWTKYENVWYDEIFFQLKL